MRSAIFIIAVSLALSGCRTRGTRCDGVNGPAPIIEVSIEDYDKGVDTPPMLITYGPTEIVYPVEILRMNITGIAVCEGVVGENGRFESVRGIEASRPLFLRAAIDGSKYWQFVPAKRAGKPVLCTIKFKIWYNNDWNEQAQPTEPNLQ